MILILYIVSTLKKSGTTIQILNIVKHLDPAKFKIHVLTLSPESGPTYYQDFVALGADVASLNLSRSAGFFLGKKKLVQYIELLKPDLIHTQGIRADGYTPLLAINFPVVSTIQNYPYYDYTMLYGRIRGSFMAYKHIKSLEKRGNVIACSKSVAQNFQVLKGINLNVIQNGVDTDKYAPANDIQQKEIRKQLKLPANKKIFISIGVLIRRKDMQTVIKGFLQGTQKGDAVLLIAGEGAERKQLEKMIANETNIFILGNVTHVEKYLRASDFFISASRAEGLPNTVLEAMACGLPVILSDIAPHKEFFDGQYQYPYFFNCADSVMLADQIRNILEEDRRFLSSRMQQIINENFSATIMSQRYQKLYLNLLDTR